MQDQSTKCCPRCHNPRPLTDFSAGHPWCKPCKTEYGRERRRQRGIQPRKPKQTREEWLESHRLNQRRFRRTETYREWRSHYVTTTYPRHRDWVTQNPEKVRAHRAVKHALRTGKLTRQPCEVCGVTERVHAHHDSYERDQWLNVRWLCVIHHAEVHR